MKTASFIRAPPSRCFLPFCRILPCALIFTVRTFCKTHRAPTPLQSAQELSTTLSKHAILKALERTGHGHHECFPPGKYEGSGSKPRARTRRCSNASDYVRGLVRRNQKQRRWQPYSTLPDQGSQKRHRTKVHRTDVTAAARPCKPGHG